MSMRARRWYTGLIALMLLAVQVLMPVQSAFATHQNNNQNNAGKVYVCKYVGTPGVNERLQTGQNPIEVSVNATSGAGVGSYFNDGQGRSYVLAPVVAGQPEPDVTACPKVINVANIVITQTPVCGPANDTITITPLANVTFTQSNWVWFGNYYKTVYATRDAGYSWSDGSQNAVKSFTFKDDNTKCDTVIPVPQQPSVTDPCGLANATWVKPADTAQYTWAIDNGGNLVVTAKDGYVFTGNVKTYNYGIAPDNGLRCEIPVPPKPTVTDPCNVYGNNASWNVPANTSQYSWSIDQSGNLIVTALGGNSFPNQQLTYNFGKPADKGIKCATPEMPTVIDVCGRLHDKFVIKSTVGVDYYVAGFKLGAGTYPALLSSFGVTAKAKANYELQGTSSWTLSFTNEYCEPDVKVKISTYCHPDGQKFALKVENPTWSNQRYEVVVRDDEGNVLATKVFTTGPYGSDWFNWMATVEGTYTFTVYSYNEGKRGEKLKKIEVTTECATDVFTPEIYKRDQFGNLVTGARFTIEVCQMSDKKNYDLRVKLDDWKCQTFTDVDLGTDGMWFANNVENYDHYKPTKVTITESYIPPACKSDGPWTFTWDYDKQDIDKQKSYGHHGSKDNSGSWSNGTHVWNLLNNCTQGMGSVGGETPAGGGQGAAGELPDELPMTGPNQALISLIGVLVAIATYGVTYFAQPRKRFDS